VGFNFFFFFANMFLDFDLLNGFFYLFSFFLSLKLHSFCFMVCFRDVGFFGSEIFVDCLLVLHSTLPLPLPLPLSLSLVLDMEVFLSLCFSSQLSRSLPVWVV